MLSEPGRVKATAPHTIHVSRDLCTSSKTTFVSFAEEEFHDKVSPFHDDLLPIFWGAGPYGTLLGTDTPTRSRTTCQNLWPGFLRANCGGALYVQPRSTGFESESLPYLDLGAQDRPGHLRNKRQGWQAGQGYVQPVTAQQRAGQRKRRNRACFRERQLLVHFPFPRVLGHQRQCDGQGQAKIADWTGYGEAGVSEISGGGWRLHAGGHLGSVCREGWTNCAVLLSSGWTQEAESPPSNLDGLQESRPSPYLNRPSRDGGWQAGANLLFECVRQASGRGQVDGRAIGNARLVPSIDVVYTASSWNEDYLQPNPAI